MITVADRKVLLSCMLIYNSALKNCNATNIRKNNCAVSSTPQLSTTFLGRRSSYRDQMRAAKREEYKKAQEMLQQKLKLEQRLAQINNSIPESILSFVVLKDVFRQNPRAVQIAYNIKDDENESLYLLDKGENIVDYFGGNEHSVCFSVNDDKHCDCVSLHNHPSKEGFDAPFSVEDIDIMITEKQSSAIVSSPKSLYGISRKGYVDLGLVKEYLKHVDTLLKTRRNELRVQLDNSEITREVADRTLFGFLNGLWQGFAKNSGWEYSSIHWPQ